MVSAGFLKLQKTGIPESSAKYVYCVIRYSRRSRRALEISDLMQERSTLWTTGILRR